MTFIDIDQEKSLYQKSDEILELPLKKIYVKRFKFKI